MTSFLAALPPLSLGNFKPILYREEKEDTFTVQSLELSQREQEEQKEPEDMAMPNAATPQNNMITFGSTKQIIDECERIMKEDTASADENKVLNFRELLSWKMPEHFCSNSNNKQFNRQRVLAGEGVIFNNQINLYKLDFVTQRLKEQRVNFCGIVCHVKQYVTLSFLYFIG